MFNNDDHISNASQFAESKVGDGEFKKINNQNRAQIPYDQRKLSQITIKQIKTAAPPQQEEHLVIDGVEISQILMVAQIVSIDIQTSHIALKVNDSTGTLDAKQWINENQPQALVNHELMLGKKGRWVKIIGRINHFGGRCSINVFEIFPIEDFNEITHHFLECIYAHLENTVGDLGKKKQASKLNNDTVDNNNNGINKNDNNINNGLPMIQNKILQIINVPEYEQTDAGCYVEKIFEKLSSENINQVREAIDLLCDAGYIYSTVDDEHFKYSGDHN